MPRRSSNIVQRTGRPSHRLLVGLAVAAVAAAAGTCRAQVIEIAPDGQAVTYAAPAVFTLAGVSAIGAEQTAPHREPDVSKLIAEAATRHQLSRALVTEVARRESRFHQKVVSERGAVGVMQLTAATASDLGVDRYDASQNIYGGAAYLRRMLDRYGGDLRLALAAYNAGPGAVDRYHGVPPFQETRSYVAAIMSRLPLTAALAPIAPLAVQ